MGYKIRLERLEMMLRCNGDWALSTLSDGFRLWHNGEMLQDFAFLQDAWAMLLSECA